MMGEENRAEQVEYFCNGEILHEVKLAHRPYGENQSYIGKAEAWLEEPESASRGRYTVRIKPFDDDLLKFHSITIFYFDDATTAFNFKLRWA